MQQISLASSRQTVQHWISNAKEFCQLHPCEMAQAIGRSTWFQIGLLIGIWWLAAQLAAGLGVPQLGNVFGMAGLWLLLVNNRIHLKRVQAGAHWLIKHMLLFFIPAVLVVLDHQELLGWVGVKLFAIIVLGTLTVMACTALSIEWYLRLVRHRKAMQRLRHRQLRHSSTEA